jgi:ketosteroid isomerase-like protein
MQQNSALITNFYTAFQRKDWAAMAACYHPEATFRDEAFDLKSGAEAGAMWQMLLSASKDLRIEFRDVQADENTGSACWDAWYTFSRTGRPVHNIIRAEFEFRDGLIYRHRDRFDFWRWSRQALGAPGWLLGWSGFLRSKVQATAMRGLRVFMKNSAGA